MLTHTIDPPQTPHPSPLQPQPRKSEVQPQMVYVYEQPRWEYRLWSKGPDDVPPSETDLNTLGADGWELVGVAAVSDKLQMIFKRAKR